MWGIAFSLNPIHWRLGWSDAMDTDPATGRNIVVGRWFFLGPLAITYDYEEGPFGRTFSHSPSGQ